MVVDVINPKIGNVVLRRSGVPEEVYAIYGSRRLQWARTWRNYPFAIGWMAHELTHRWAAYAQWNCADPRALLDPSCYCHWNALLNTPAV